MTRKPGDHTFQVSYSRRVTRPNESFLNPVPAQNLVNSANFHVKSISDPFRFSQFVRPEHQVVNLTLTYNFKRTAQTERTEIGSEFQR